MPHPHPVSPAGPFDRFVDRASDAVALIGFASLLGLTCMVTADVIARWVFNSPLHGVNDMSAVVISVAIAACMPASLRGRRHITITALGRAIGPRTAAVLDAFGALVLLLMMLLIAWQFVDYTRDKFVSGHTTWILRWPTGPWWLAVAFLFAASAVVQAAMVWQALRRIARPGDASEADGVSAPGEASAL